MVNEISIVAGDPFTKEGGASFTCFVLPFRFNPGAFSDYELAVLSPKDVPRYTPIDMDSQAWVKRKRYFTSETAKVLYEHARWFELSASHWESFELCKLFDFKNAQQRRIKVRLHPPRLALFEWHDAMVGEQQKKADLFQTGFLIIEASFVENVNVSAPTYADLLNFNELFRYWRVPYDGHERKLRIAMGGAFGLQAEDLYFNRWAKLLQIPVQPAAGKKLCALFPKPWETKAKSWWNSEAKNQPLTAYQGVQDKDPGWIGYADERTFVWSCVVVKEGTNALPLMGGEGNEPTEELGAWIKLLNVDHPGDVAFINKATSFEKEWVKDRSYDRWLHFGTLYGFNYHAGVMLTGPCDEPPITRHFHDQYLDMTLLLLYLRVTLFRFSNELTCFSADMRKSNDDWLWLTNFLHRISNTFHRYCNFVDGSKHIKPIINWKKDFQVLRKEFAVFTNLYQFPLISNQQLAVEMYELIRKYMDVKDLFREIEEEIKSSHEYFQLEEESKLNTRIFWLTIIGVFIAILNIPSAIKGWEKLLIIFNSF